MKPYAFLGSLASVLALSGCVVMPVGPMMAALPGSQKDMEQFRYDDYSCRAAAQASVSGASEAATNDAAANAVLGTAIGAAAGAITGAGAGDAGAGAAIGAGTGLLFGSTAGSNYAGHASSRLQRAYDASYLQCMYGRGHKVPAGFVQQAPTQRYFAPTYPPQNYPPPPANVPLAPSGTPGR